MTVLITGAAGFIGLNAVEQLLRADRHVVALSLAPLPEAATAAFAALPGRLEVSLGDVRDGHLLAGLFSRHAPEAVLHTAAITAGPQADPARAETVLAVNVAATAALLQLAREHQVRRVVLTSSAAVYGDGPFEATPLTEASAPRPQTLYAISKLAAEALATRFRESFGLDVIRTRLTAIYGPWEHDSGVRDTLSPPLQIATAALRGAPVVLARGGLRDWTYGPDIARALVRLLDAPHPAHTLYNLGCGRIWHPEALCQALQKRHPGWQWRLTEDGEAPTIAYNDALDRVRLSPPSPVRFETEFGSTFSQGGDSATDYADWIANHGAALHAAT